MTALQARIRAEALRWRGTPFHHHADLRGVGCDCIGLVVGVLRAAGLVPGDCRLPSYSADFMMHRDDEVLLAGLREHCREVQTPEVGDILVYRYGRAASHCGFYLGEGNLIHAVSRHEVRVEAMSSPALASRFVGAFRLNALCEEATCRP